MENWAGIRRGGRCTSGAAICSTRTTPCAASSSAMNRRTFRISYTCNWGSRETGGFISPRGSSRAGRLSPVALPFARFDPALGNLFRLGGGIIGGREGDEPRMFALTLIHVLVLGAFGLFDGHHLSRARLARPFVLGART